MAAQDLDLAGAKVAWKELYSGVEGLERYKEDVRLRGASADWRLTGAYSIASAEDYHLADSKDITETPVSLSGRRRANSVDDEEKLAEFEAVRQANLGVPRSFLRTWVRIVHKDAPELRKVGTVR